jgi:hypothetical protein
VRALIETIDVIQACESFRDRSELRRGTQDRLMTCGASMTSWPDAARHSGRSWCTDTQDVLWLRRGEIAVLSGLSPDYSTRVEQGHKRNPPAQLIESLAVR